MNPHASDPKSKGGVVAPSGFGSEEKSGQMPLLSLLLRAHVAPKMIFAESHGHNGEQGLAPACLAEIRVWLFDFARKGVGFFLFS